MRQQLSGIAREHAQKRELVRRQLNRPSADRDRTLLEVDPQLAQLDDRLSRSVRSAQRGTKAREQLLDAERLRHVVVCAGVQRGYLLGLVADDGEDDDGRGAPCAELAGDVGAAAVG